MQKNKVYFVGVDSAKHQAATPEKTSELHEQVFNLALQRNETVFFHRYKGDVGGASGLLVECAPDFANAMKTLPLFGVLREQNDGLATARAGHAGPYEKNDLKAVYGFEAKGEAFQAAFELNAFAQDKGREGELLIRQIREKQDGTPGFVSFLLSGNALNKEMMELPALKGKTLFSRESAPEPDAQPEIRKGHLRLVPKPKP